MSKHVGERDDGVFPMVALLLSEVRRVSVAEARRAVASELGDEAATTVEAVSENSVGMSYIQWRAGTTPYHLGTSPDPYINAVGVGRVDGENRIVGPLKWTMREEVPPEADDLCDAWMSHTAWLYVDALPFHSHPSEVDQHIRRVLRIASHFIDERCVLLWLWGGEPKRVALPTPEAITALAAGTWPY